MKKETIWCNLFLYSSPTYYNWKKGDRPIVKLLDKYFSNENLKEFLEKGTIEEFEYLNKIKEIASSKEFELFKQFLEFQNSQNSTSKNIDNLCSLNKELEKENQELKNKLKKLQEIMK